jgi:hypothetical protein
VLVAVVLMAVASAAGIAAEDSSRVAAWWRLVVAVAVAVVVAVAVAVAIAIAATVTAPATSTASVVLAMVAGRGQEVLGE